MIRFLPATGKTGVFLRLWAVALTMLASPCAAAPGPTVRIGVFGLFHPAALSVVAPADQTLLLRAGNRSIALQGAQRAELLITGQSVRCNARGGTVAAPSIQVSGLNGDGLLLAVPGKLERQFRGTLEVAASGGELIAVVTMDLEVAVASVVAAESLPGAPLEALKAQAVVARSYYVGPRRHTGSGFSFCDTTHCQFIREAHGFRPGSPTDGGDTAARAAAETRGLVLTYRGVAVPALYSASCGGRTRSLAEVGLKTENYPYYAVDCAYCRQASRTWESRLRLDQAASLLAHTSERSRLLAGRELGWSRVPASNYQVWMDGATVVLRGRGAGHGVGLCQTGAAAMASAGWDFRAILAYYYPNTTLR